MLIFSVKFPVIWDYDNSNITRICYWEWTEKIKNMTKHHNKVEKKMYNKTDYKQRNSRGNASAFPKWAFFKLAHHIYNWMYFDETQLPLVINKNFLCMLRFFFFYFFWFIILMFLYLVIFPYICTTGKRRTLTTKHTSK